MSLDSADSVYRGLAFGPAPADRPYIVMDMVSTIDGKTVSGDRDDHVIDLGSKLDHQTLRVIESCADAVLIGAATLRATPITWSPRPKLRFVVTSSGALPSESAFLNEGESYVVSPRIAAPHFVKSNHFKPGESSDFDLARVLAGMKHDLGIETLLVEGGSEINAQFLTRDMIDELFLTIAPKIKLGRETPTYAGGEPLPRDSMLKFELIEHHAVEGEVFLRYRRSR